jgi:hypothetical protein
MGGGGLRVDFENVAKGRLGGIEIAGSESLLALAKNGGRSLR